MVISIRTAAEATQITLFGSDGRVVVEFVRASQTCAGFSVRNPARCLRHCFERGSVYYRCATRTSVGVPRGRRRPKGHRGKDSTPRHPADAPATVGTPCGLAAPARPCRRRQSGPRASPPAGAPPCPSPAGGGARAPDSRPLPTLPPPSAGRRGRRRSARPTTCRRSCVSRATVGTPHTLALPRPCRRSCPSRATVGVDNALDTSLIVSCAGIPL